MSVKNQEICQFTIKSDLRSIQELLVHKTVNLYSCGKQDEQGQGTCPLDM